jgi:putative lipoic acid-binding regulatory protein
MTSDKENPEIIYPCQWTYSVMGHDEEDLRLCIGEVMRGRAHKVTLGRQSAGKKYIALHVDVWVVDEADRDALFEAFRDHPKVKFVL